MRDAGEHKTWQTQHSFLLAWLFHVGSIRHTNQMSSWEVAKRWWIHYLKQLLQSFVNTLSGWGACISDLHLVNCFLCVCRALALRRATAWSCTHRPTSQTWEKVSERRAVGCIDVICISACGFRGSCVCKALYVLGLSWGTGSRNRYNCLSGSTAVYIFFTSLWKADINIFYGNIFTFHS